MKFYDSKIVQKRMSVFALVAGCVCLLVAAVGGGLVLFGSPRVRGIGAVVAGIHAVIAAVLFVAFALWRRMLFRSPETFPAICRITGILDSACRESLC